MADNPNWMDMWDPNKQRDFENAGRYNSYQGNPLSDQIGLDLYGAYRNAGNAITGAVNQAGSAYQAAASNAENQRRFDLMQGKDSARWKFLNGYDPQGRANNQQFGYTTRMGGDPTLNPYEYNNPEFQTGLAAYNQQYSARSPLIADRLRQIGPLLGAFLPGGGGGGGFNTDFGMSVRPAIAPYPYTNPVA